MFLLKIKSISIDLSLTLKTLTLISMINFLCGISFLIKVSQLKTPIIKNLVQDWVNLLLVSILVLPLEPMVQSTLCWESHV